MGLFYRTPEGRTFKLETLARVVNAALALLFLGLGALSIGFAYAPEYAWVKSAHKQLERELPVTFISGENVIKILEHPAARPLLPGFGLVLLALALRSRRLEVIDTDAMGGALPVADRRTRRRSHRRAARLLKKGDAAAAGEVFLEAGFSEEAADCFAKAGDFVRAAEIQYDHNRFEEAADFYLQAGQYEGAANIYAAQGDFLRAGECYERAERKSLAAEMFEKAGDFIRAGDCYVEAGFHRHAVRAYLRCRAVEKAALALESVLSEQLGKAGSTQQSAKQSKEVRGVALKAAKLWEQAGKFERALAVLERGECFAAAGEIALSLERFEQAGDLFQKAQDLPRAAEAYRRTGDAERAARLLGEYHRDRGDTGEAALLLEQAGDFNAAGDLYRASEQYEQAGACYARSGDHMHAAEMFRLVSNVERAAECFEHAGRFAEAAECAAELGDRARQACLLEQAGNYFVAGQLHQELGDEREAIRVLQRVEAGHPAFSKATALLGQLFREKGMHTLAIKKLRQAVEGTEIQHDNVKLYYDLATLCEERGRFAEASELYEKILTCDYHYADVAERLTLVREQLRWAPADNTAPAGGGGNTQPTSGSGRYQVLEELGRGGMGIVYKARDTVLDRDVAFKVLPAQLRENPQALKNFLREAKSAAQLNHPNIVTVYDAGEQDGCCYIAMEFVDGTTLREILKRRKIIPPNGVIQILVQLCDALAYAHSKKVIHRDVKTANTMWTRDRKAKIMDFGLAKIVEEVRLHTTMVSGTPYYMSPEQTLGHNVDHRTDIYSLGVMMFELATGTLPFKEGNVPYHHVHTAPPDPQQINPQLPDLLARIIRRCLEKSPDRRYESASDILTELRAAHAEIRDGQTVS